MLIAVIVRVHVTCAVTVVVASTARRPTAFPRDACSGAGVRGERRVPWQSPHAGAGRRVCAAQPGWQAGHPRRDCARAGVAAGEAAGAVNE